MKMRLNCLAFLCLPFLALGQESEKAKDALADKLVFRASLLAGVSNAPNFPERNNRHYFNPRGVYFGLSFNFGKEKVGLSASYFRYQFFYSESKIQKKYPSYNKGTKGAEVVSDGVFVGPYFGSMFGAKKKLGVEFSPGFGFVAERRDRNDIDSATNGLIDWENEILTTTAFLFRGQTRYYFSRLDLSFGVGADLIFFTDNDSVVTPNFYGLIMLPF